MGDVEKHRKSVVPPALLRPPSFLTFHAIEFCFSWHGQNTWRQICTSFTFTWSADPQAWLKTVKTIPDMACRNWHCTPGAESVWNVRSHNSFLLLPRLINLIWSFFGSNLVTRTAALLNSAPLCIPKDAGAELHIVKHYTLECKHTLGRWSY